MKDFRKEEKIGKAYDSKLMKRLLNYARPYWKILLLCIILLLFVTGVELARPYFIQRAIDNHINVSNHELVVFEELPEEDVEAVPYQDNYLIRERLLEENYPDQERWQIIRSKGTSYLMRDYFQSSADIEFTEESGEMRAYYDDQSQPLTPLSTEKYREFREQDYTGLNQIGITLLAIMIGGFFLNYLQVYLLNKTSQKIIFNMRHEMFTHLQQMSLAYFDKNPVGRLVTRLTNDTETLNDMYTGVLVNLFKDLFMLIGIVIIMFSMNARLALSTFAVLPLVLLVAVVFRRFVRDAYREVRVKLARINSTISEDISGMKIIQLFNQQSRKLKEFKEINNEYYDATIRQIFIYAIFRPAMDLLYSLALAILIWYGGGRVVASALEFGVLYAFTDYLRRFFRPINDLTEKYNILQSAMASSERIFRIMDTKAEIADPEKPEELPHRLEGRIDFENVSFSYDEKEWVLKDINLSIQPGETVALVGATGAGKSSMIKLLSRFYDIQKGQIKIDGIDIRKFPRHKLREHIGVVLQEVFLFTGTVADNITLHNEEITEEEVKESAQYVNADKFISNLKNGYQHKVTERGSTFSAGEKQLIAFARTLAYDPDILVLDEATANIDTETELLIQDALVKLTENRTTIVIAHRLSTIQDADRIVVLHKGKIREVGSHQELLAKEGIYYDLYQLQYKDQLIEQMDRKTS